ncbi:hypothetical protein ACQKWADRAFT_300992 [Trichoderma austrokoningii]
MAPRAKDAGEEPARKRSLEDSRADAEGEQPAKQARTSSPPRLELSKENLRRFNREEEMGSDDSSTTASSEAEAETVRSQCSSDSAANYRHLAAAAVYIHTDPPADILAAIEAVVKAQVSEQRRAELCAIAQQLHEGCKKAVRAAVGDDDFLVLFLTALRAMDHSSLSLRAKADWREDIKPAVRQPDLNLSFMADFNVSVKAKELTRHLGRHTRRGPRLCPLVAKS